MPVCKWKIHTFSGSWLWLVIQKEPLWREKFHMNRDQTLPGPISPNKRVNCVLVCITCPVTAGQVDHIPHLLTCLLRFPWKMTIWVPGGLTRSRRKTWTGRKKLRRPSLTSRSSPSNTFRSLPEPRKVGCAATVSRKRCNCWINSMYTYSPAETVSVLACEWPLWGFTARLTWFDIHEAVDTTLPSQALGQTRTTYWFFSASSTLPLCRVRAPYATCLSQLFPVSTDWSVYCLRIIRLNKGALFQALEMETGNGVWL